MAQVPVSAPVLPEPRNRPGTAMAPEWHRSDFKGWDAPLQRAHPTCKVADCAHCALWGNKINRCRVPRMFPADPEDPESCTWVKLGVDGGIGCRICAIANFPIGRRKWARCGISATPQELVHRLAKHACDEVHVASVRWFFSSLKIEGQMFNILDDMEAGAEEILEESLDRARRCRSQCWEMVLDRVTLVRATRRLAIRRRRLEALRRRFRTKDRLAFYALCAAKTTTKHSGPIKTGH